MDKFSKAILKQTFELLLRPLSHHVSGILGTIDEIYDNLQALANEVNRDASSTESGRMSAEDKVKLNGIQSGAQVNSVTGVKGSNESAYRTGQVSISKDNIGLGKVENKSASDILGGLTSENVTNALGFTPLSQNTNTTYTITQDANDGHKFTFTGSDGSSTTITIPDKDTTYSAATKSATGLMSTDDKKKLDAISVTYDSTNEGIVVVTK